jgi:methyltransferase
VDSRVAFTALVALVALLRLAELAVSRRHIEALRQRGAIELGAGHYPWMVAVHAGFLIGGPSEVWLLDRPWLPALGVPMLGLLGVGTALRYWAIRTLGERWSTRVIVVPGAPLVGGGPYRWLRHPNYLGVVLELAALPLVHTAWLTAALASVANAFVLRRRIAVEDEAHREWHGEPAPEAE